MPNAIYSYVYYEQLPKGGTKTRQNRNLTTLPTYLPVPGLTVPSTNGLAIASLFLPDLPPATYTDSSGNVYNFGFMNVSGCAGTGETSTDINHLPGSAPFPRLVVTNQVIKILVVYIRHEVGRKGGPSICLDAFDETAGIFLHDYFLQGINPDDGLKSDVEVFGYLPVQGYEEFIVAARNPKNIKGVADSSAVFHKWGKLEGPDGNPVMGDNGALTVNRNATSNITVFAFYKQQASYIFGGYHSTDIILFTPFSAHTRGADIRMGNENTLLLSGGRYGFAAMVHNDTAYDTSTNVTFWNIPGEVGQPGTLLDLQTVTVPAGGSVIVFSSQPFINSGGHYGAAVSISVPDSPCQFNPTSSRDSVHIPSPVTVPGGDVIPHSCSAWRNTFAITGSAVQP